MQFEALHSKFGNAECCSLDLKTVYSPLFLFCLETEI